MHVANGNGADEDGAVGSGENIRNSLNSSQSLVSLLQLLPDPDVCGG